MLGFLVAMISGIVYLLSRERKFDIVSLASIEVGMVFALINVITGSIWAKPIWNTWWTWDPRLTTTTIMLMIYAAYFLLRAGIDNPDRQARFGAVYTIVGFLSVPLTFFSVRLTRTIHPVVVNTNQLRGTGAFDMTPAMLQTFLFSLLTFSFIFISLLWHRIRLGKLVEKVENLKFKITE